MHSCRNVTQNEFETGLFVVNREHRNEWRGWEGRYVRQMEVNLEKGKNGKKWRVDKGKGAAPGKVMVLELLT